jgi:hypothetical protein
MSDACFPFMTRCVRCVEKCNKRFLNPFRGRPRPRIDRPGWHGSSPAPVTMPSPRPLDGCGARRSTRHEVGCEAIAAGLVTSIIAGQSLGSWHARVFKATVGRAGRFTGAEKTVPGNVWPAVRWRRFQRMRRLKRLRSVAPTSGAPSARVKSLPAPGNSGESATSRRWPNGDRATKSGTVQMTYDYSKILLTLSRPPLHSLLGHHSSMNETTSGNDGSSHRGNGHHRPRAGERFEPLSGAPGD